MSSNHAFAHNQLANLFDPNQRRAALAAFKEKYVEAMNDLMRELGDQTLCSVNPPLNSPATINQRETARRRC